MPDVCPASSRYKITISNTIDGSYFYRQVSIRTNDDLGEQFINQAY